MYVRCYICNPKGDKKLDFIVQDTEVRHLVECGWKLEDVGVLLCFRRDNYTLCKKFSVNEHINHLCEAFTPDVDTTIMWKKDIEMKWEGKRGLMDG